jgi:hypothetical protein
MMKPRNSRHLLLATVAMTLFTGQAGAQLLSETLLNPNIGVQVPGADNLISGGGRVIQSRTVTSSVDPALENPGAAVPSDFSTVGDNLGNHIAIKDMQMSGNSLNMQGGDILSGGGRVLGIQEIPFETDEASSKFYVDSLNSQLSDAITVIEGDVQTLFSRRINTPANQGLTGGGPLTSDLTLTVDGTVVRTGGDQVIAGAKTFIGSVDLRDNRLLGVGTPTAQTDGVNKAYVDTATNALGSQIQTLDETFRSRRIDTGTGLLGGGDLSQNRTLTFDTAWGDARYAIRARRISAGDGLTGGGDLSADRTFALDATVVRTSGNQTIAGNKSFTGLLSFSNNRLTSVGTPTVASDAATKGYVDGVRADLESSLTTLTGRRIDTGTGLLGGGDLSQNRTLVFDTAWGDLRYALRSRTLNAGDGLSGGGDLAADRSFSVDATVVRTSGAQTIAGDKTFRQGTGTRFERGAGLDAVNLRGGSAGTAGYSVTITPGVLTANRVLTLADGATTLVPGTMVPTARSLIAGDGLSGGGDLASDRTFSVNSTVVRTSGDQVIGGAKSFTGSLSFSSNRLTLVGTPTAASDAATKGYVDGISSTLQADVSALFSRRIDAGTGLTGGGDLSANRVIGFDVTWGDGRYALRNRMIAAGDGLTGGGDLSANRTLAVDSTVVRTPRRVGTGTGLTGGGDLSADRTLAFDTVWGDGRYAEHVTSGFANTITYDDVFGATGNGAATFGHSGAARPSDAPVTGQSGGIHIGNTWGRSQLVFPNASNRIFFRNGTQTAWSEVWHSGNLNVSDLTPISRAINTGTGLIGGGTLSVDRTLAFDTAWGDTRYALSARNLTAGDGLTGGGMLTADRAFAVDATVVRTSGAQTIGGAKTFTASPNFSNLRVLGVATPTQGTDAANKAYVDTAVSGAAGTTYTAGTGLTLSGSAFSITDVAAGSAVVGTIRYNGTTAAAGRFYGGATAPSNTTRLNYDGALYATQLFDGGVRVVNQNRNLIAGDGITGGGDLSANRTFAVDGTVVRTTRSLSAGDGLTGGGTLAGDRSFSVDATVVRTSGAQTIGGAKTFTASPNFSNLRVLGVATPTQGTDAANKAYVDAAVSASAGTTYTAGTGLTLTGTTFALADNQIRRDALSTSAGVVAYNGHTAANGQFYGGTTNPTSTNAAHRVNFQGSVYATRFYATQYFYFSDETLKENVNRIEGAEGMALLREIRPVRYEWTETGREALGVIAQETARVLPNLVDTDPNGIMSVDYIQLIAPLIAAVQELDARVISLEAENSARNRP